MKLINYVIIALAFSSSLNAIDLNPKDLAEKAFNEAKDAANKAANAAKNIAQQSVNQAKEIAEKAADAAKKAAQQAGDIAKKAVGSAKGIAQDMARQAKEQAEKAADHAKDLASKVGDTAKDVGKGIKGAAEEVGEDVKVTAQDLGKDVKKFGNLVGKPFKEAFNYLKDTFNACKDSARLGVELPAVMISEQVARAALNVAHGMLDNAKHIGGEALKAADVVVKVGEMPLKLSGELIHQFESMGIDIKEIKAHVKLKEIKKTMFMATVEIFGKTLTIEIDPFDPKKTFEAIMKEAGHAGSAVGKIAHAA
jgi:uncharacterized phage infection (PIP) family protein YhgE